MDIFTGFILLMFVSGTDSPMEFTPKNSMVDCLTSKRKIMRNYKELHKGIVSNQNDADRLILEIENQIENRIVGKRKRRGRKTQS